MENIEIFDLIGIGFGIPNISLAISLKETNSNLSYKFIEPNVNHTDYIEKLIDHYNIRDDISKNLLNLLAPYSKYSFINFLHSHNILDLHVNLDVKLIMQKNYANYIRWCIDSLKDEVDYCPITKLSLIYDASRREYLYKITTERNDYYARSIVLSTSKVFDIPSIFQPFIGKEVFHISAYSKHIKAFSKDKEHNFAIVGESEFVTEIQWDLYRNFPNSRITSFASACSFNSKNSNYFISENYYTSNIEFFYKNALVAYNNQQKTNCNFLDSSQNFYYSISRQPEDVQRLFVKNNTILDSVTKKNDRYLLSYKNTSEEDVFPGEFDAIIIATAFKNQNFKEAQEYYSGLIEKVRSCFNIDSDGNFAINQNHSLQSAKEFIPPIFINERYQFDIDNFWPNLLIRNSEIIEAINFYLSKNEVSSS